MDSKEIMVRIDRNGIVTKSNCLIEASYTLTLNEQRIILACAAKLDGRKPMPKDAVFTLTAEEFCNLFGTDPASTYPELREAANRLFEREIQRIDGRSRTRIRWVYIASYQDGAGAIKVGFSPEIAPYLTMLHKKFTSYRIADVAMLRTVYAIRLFEMIAQYSGTGRFVINVEDFKDRLGLTERYTRFSNLKARVIQPAVDELIQKTSLEIIWKVIKKGRTAVRIEFLFKEKQQLQLAL